MAGALVRTGAFAFQCLGARPMLRCRFRSPACKGLLQEQDAAVIHFGARQVKFSQQQHAPEAVHIRKSFVDIGW